MKAWQENLEKLKQFKKTYNHTDVPANWKEDRLLAQWVENIIASKNRLPIELRGELEKLHFDFDYKKKKGWENMHSELVAFQNKYGHTYVPVSEPYRELSAWVENQKNSKDRLHARQITLLDTLGLDWNTYTKKTGNWEFMYYELKRFKEKYGHTRVVHTDNDHKKLVTWVHNIRNRSHLLDASQKKKLNAIGFLWSEDLRKQVEDQWLMRFGELKEFKKQTGHCNVPIKWKGNPELAQWVSENRLREKNKGLLPERKKMLDKIGFSWSEDLIKQADAHWNSMLENLKTFHATYGHMRIPKKEYALKMWVMSQRIMIRDGYLELKKQKKLDSIGFVSTQVHDNYWEKMYEQLKQYISRFGNTVLIIRSKYPVLGYWVVQQRQSYSKGLLSDARIKKLNKLGFKWSHEIQKGAWMTMYNHLVAFKEKYNHTRVPSNKPRYEKLFTWATKQRIKFKAGRISKTEYDLLCKQEFTWENFKELHWELMFEKLLLFKKQTKHLKVSEKTHAPLFRWISKQRQKHKNGKLTEYQINRLKKLGLDLKLRWRVASKL